MKSLSANFFIFKVKKNQPAHRFRQLLLGIASFIIFFVWYLKFNPIAKNTHPKAPCFLKVLLCQNIHVWRTVNLLEMKCLSGKFQFNSYRYGFCFFNSSRTNL